MRAALVAALVMLTTPVLADGISPEDLLIQHALVDVGKTAIEYQRASAWMMVCKDDAMQQALKMAALTKTSDIVRAQMASMNLGEQYFDIDRISGKLSSWLSGYKFGYFDSILPTYQEMSAAKQKETCDSIKTEARRLLQ